MTLYPSGLLRDHPKMRSEEEVIRAIAARKSGTALSCSARSHEDVSPPPASIAYRVLDLFCGACGGWSTGLHRTGGFTTVAACEIDPWRRATFGRNFPGARLYDDVRTVTAERLRADGAFPDIIVGSPPCQDASTANTKGRGIDGERTGLYMEAVRIVAECRPRWAAFENVPGIRNRGIDRVLGALEQAGYAAWPLVVGALDLGAPHERKRSWIVAADAATVQRLALPWSEPDRAGESATADTGHAGRAESDIRIRCTSAAASSATHEIPGGLAGDAYGEGLEEWQGERGDARTQRTTPLRAIGAAWHWWNGGAARFDRVDDGLPKGLARAALAAYGDAVVPAISEMIGRAILANAMTPKSVPSVEQSLDRGASSKKPSPPQTC